MQTLNYKLKRLCNYLILNLSSHCRFVTEIGIEINIKNVQITLRASPTNFDDAKSGLNDIFKKFSQTRKELELNGFAFDTHLISNKFSEKFILSQLFYYFTPEKTRQRYIFKYLPVSINLINLFNSNELWFSDPRTFNDPFDTRYSIDADPEEVEILNFYYAKTKKLGGNADLLLSDFSSTFTCPSKDQFLNDLENHHYINTLASQYGICCFSEKHNNHLLWSHYADNAKGICLVFDQKTEPRSDYYIFSGLKVKYRSAIIKKFYDGSPYMDITDIVYSKYKDWKYEHEIRELRSFEKGNANRTVPFDPRSLTGIIFGPKANVADKVTIKNLISQLTKYQIDFMDSKINLNNHTIGVSRNRFGLK